MITQKLNETMVLQLLESHVDEVAIEAIAAAITKRDQIISELRKNLKG